MAGIFMIIFFLYGRCGNVDKHFKAKMWANFIS